MRSFWISTLVIHISVIAQFSILLKPIGNHLQNVTAPNINKKKTFDAVNFEIGEWEKYEIIEEVK